MRPSIYKYKDKAMNKTKNTEEKNQAKREAMTMFFHPFFKCYILYKKKNK